MQQATMAYTDDAVLAKLDAMLPTAFDIKYVFNRFTLGDGFLKDGLGIGADQLGKLRQVSRYAIAMTLTTLLKHCRLYSGPGKSSLCGTGRCSLMSLGTWSMM